MQPARPRDVSQSLGSSELHARHWQSASSPPTRLSVDQTSQTQEAMANFRQFRPSDLSKLSKCNLDPFTETYELSFYLQYHAKWPSLFQVAEDQHGNIIGYSA
ncbi:N-acetyltransferase 5 [Magnaporthiopsis poae ATCC 64411]|uniref:N-acetyltransferase 5 n=1 Tax=Magnaporthiopsis poae (strain ATCC 64411 / 73-15) TaxID=644358 RepID=A0A0C4E920_MAGP6|nr:N-acetyltransferase 5 [Magnaporthiopsis poae ATCC 64411]